MVILSWLVACAVAAVFVVGGVEKLRVRSAFARTLSELGLPAPLVPVLSLLVPIAELATSAGLMLAPAAAWPAAGVAALGAAFALAGLLGLRARQPVACSCLGAATDAYLGRRQLVLLPGWLAVAAVLRLAPPHWSVLEGLQLLALVVVASSALHAVKVVKAWRTDATYRRAIEESSEVHADMVVGLHTIKGTS
ncbi:MauE/DoxX family redox-associated membrane protein [Dactylosporangium sp. NPDC051485]|uniref:MauE/DoxX family redox-associated membrane protein n=1 Tax=Dactylosporangium sp. NPDC051485 TaxID=3154846 RepID=UPI003445D444